MLFSYWFRRASQPKLTYRPEICLLEDRVVPVVFRRFPVSTPPPATHLTIVAPAHVESGKAFKVTIEADDASNRVVPGFRGTVQISLATADAGATYPVSFTFSAADSGRHSIAMMLTVAGSQTVTASSGAISGSKTLAVDNPVTHFSVTPFGKAMIGDPTMVNVVALDANNNAVPGYTGTVHFTSTDLLATLPANYAFTAADGGAHLFAVTFGTLGRKTLTVSDISSGTIIGGTSLQVCAASYGNGMYSGYYNNWNMYPSWYGYPYGVGYGNGIAGWGFPYGYGYGYG